MALAGRHSQNARPRDLQDDEKSDFVDEHNTSTRVLEDSEHERTGSQSINEGVMVPKKPPAGSRLFSPLYAVMAWRCPTSESCYEEEATRSMEECIGAFLRPQTDLPQWKPCDLRILLCLYGGVLYQFKDFGLSSSSSFSLRTRNPEQVREPKPQA